MAFTDQKTHRQKIASGAIIAALVQGTIVALLIPGLEGLPRFPLKPSIAWPTSPFIPPIIICKLPVRPPSAQPPELPPRWVAARPSNSPARWITVDDYPSRSLRDGNQGVVRFLLDVASSGRVKACSITKSSGFSELDEATCSNISRRARFEPVVGPDGKPASGRYSNAIRWVIPD